MSMQNLSEQGADDTLAAPIVIVGTGLAGYTLAREIRKRDQEASVLVLSRDHGGYYSKPMLSNALSKKRSASALVLKSADHMASELSVNILTGTTLEHIDPANRTLQLRDNMTGKITEQPYRALVLATGAKAVAPELEGSGASGVLSINDLDDYAAFSSRLSDRVSRVAILGAGLIGCEFANDLLSRGIKPVVLDPASRPLAALLPSGASDFFRERMEEAGVSFLFEQTATRIDRTEAGYEITTSADHKFCADIVLSAVGLQPQVRVAREAGIKTGKGILANAFLETSEPGIYAMGDCAEVVGQVRPYVAPITHQASALAATLSGTPVAVAYPPMPVIIKTPACPAAVCIPFGVVAKEGDWDIELTDDGLQALWMEAESNDALRGFVLVGASACARRLALVRRLA